MWSKDLGIYRYVPSGEVEMATGFCKGGGVLGLSSTNMGEDVAVKICLRQGNQGKLAKFLDDTNIKEGVYLESLETLSLTFIHEIFHLAQRGEKSDDLLAWAPPSNIPQKRPDFSDNPNWPGEPRDFSLAEGLNFITNLIESYQAGKIYKALLGDRVIVGEL